MEMVFIWLLVIFSITGTSVLGDLACIPRQGSPGQGYICVCNSTYCDTIDRPAPLARGLFHWYSTSNSTPGFSHTTGTFQPEPSFSNSSGGVFRINASVTFQEFLGFGAAFTDTSGILISSLPAGAQDNLIESYFGTSGIEYNLGRLPIGGTDFSPRPYTLDDVPFDEDLQHFNLTEEDHSYKIPYIKKALSVSERGINLTGCSWMAPAWMKDNANNRRGYLRAKYFHVWAQYHIKFLEAYQKEGIDIWGLSGGNEVMLSMMLPVALNSLNCTLETAPIQRLWLKEHLKPLLVASNFSNVKFLGLEDARLFAPYWMSRFAEDPEAYQYLDGLALHWYFDFFSSPSILSKLHEDFPDKMIMYTESSINFAPMSKYLGPWMVAALYSHNIIENLSHWTQSYMDWNLAVDLEGGPSLGLDVAGAIVVNSTAGEFYKQPVFYAIGHFSKFIPPGSRIVQVKRDYNCEDRRPSSWLHQR
uniref:Glucosylceramidase n=1 Tax=Graphocephala atropunctata TaxID=36148 RepID=A0A1B6MEL5_9HEMI